MVKHALMALGLGVGLLGGAATAVHASTQAPARAAAHPVVRHAQAVELSEAADTVSDTDATAPCATDASGNQTGDCQDSQNQSGPQDSGGTQSRPDTVEVAGQ